MIKLSDLRNRVNDDKICVSFDYYFSHREGEVVKCSFARDKEASLVWSMLVILNRTRDADSQVYNFEFQLPKSNMDLTMVAAIGLKYFQLYLQEEIQKKSDMNFWLGELTKGMIG